MGSPEFGVCSSFPDEATPKEPTREHWQEGANGRGGSTRNHHSRKSEPAALAQVANPRAPRIRSPNSARSLIGLCDQRGRINPGRSHTRATGASLRHTQYRISGGIWGLELSGTLRKYPRSIHPSHPLAPGPIQPHYGETTPTATNPGASVRAGAASPGSTLSNPGRSLMHCDANRANNFPCNATQARHSR